MNKDEIVRAIRGERRSTLSLLRSLDADAFDLPTALPGWRVREVVAHLITIDKTTVTGANLPVVFASTARLEAWNERQVPRWASRSVPELLIGLERWGRRFSTFARAFPRALYRLPAPTQFGLAPAGLLLWSRAYDEWVHRQDIRRAVGMPDEEVDLASIVEFMLTAMSHHTVRQIPPGGSVLVALEGTPVPEWRFDLVARSGGPDGSGSASTAARIVAPAPSFIMAAAGRDSFEELDTKGILSIDGDRGLARAFLAGTRIV